MSQEDTTQTKQKIYQKLLKRFKEETDQNLQILETRLALLSATPDPEQYKEYTKQIFRAIHTIKGNSRLLNFTEISKLAIQVEAICGQLRDEGLQLADATDLLIFAATQAIDRLVEAAVEGKPQPDVNLADLLENLQKVSGISSEPAQPPRPPVDPADKAIPKPRILLGMEFYPQMLWTLQSITPHRQQPLEFSCSGGEIAVSADILEKMKESLNYALFHFASGGRWGKSCYFSLKAFKTDNTDKFYLHIISNNQINFELIRKRVIHEESISAEQAAKLSEEELFEIINKPQYFSAGLLNIGPEKSSWVSPVEKIRQQGFGFRFKEQNEQFNIFELEIPFE